MRSHVPPTPARGRAAPEPVATSPLPPRPPESSPVRYRTSRPTRASTALSAAAREAGGCPGRGVAVTRAGRAPPPGHVPPCGAARAPPAVAGSACEARPRSGCGRLGTARLSVRGLAARLAAPSRRARRRPEVRPRRLGVPAASAGRRRTAACGSGHESRGMRPRAQPGTTPPAAHRSGSAAMALPPRFAALPALVLAGALRLPLKPLQPATTTGPSKSCSSRTRAGGSCCTRVRPGTPLRV